MKKTYQNQLIPWGIFGGAQLTMCDRAGNEVCRASFNIYAVRTLFQSALVQLRAVFVVDRPGSMVWRKHVYKVSE